MRQDFRKNVISFRVSRASEVINRRSAARCDATRRDATPRLSRRFNGDEAAIIFEKLRALDTPPGIEHEGPKRATGRGEDLDRTGAFSARRVVRLIS